MDTIMLFLTLRKVFQISRASSRVPLLQLLLRDALWAFSLIWGLSQKFQSCTFSSLSDFSPAVLLLSESFVVASELNELYIGVKYVMPTCLLRTHC
jgi:hypothetical protein